MRCLYVDAIYIPSVVVTSEPVRDGVEDVFREVKPRLKYHSLFHFLGA